MERTVHIDGRDIHIKACASTAIRYQQVYGEHIDSAMLAAAGKRGDTAESVQYEGGIYETAAKLLYVMAWHCDPQNLKLNKDDALTWLDSIGPLDAEALKEVVTLFFRK